MSLTTRDEVQQPQYNMASGKIRNTDLWIIQQVPEGVGGWYTSARNCTIE